MNENKLNVLLIKPYNYFNKGDFVVNSAEPLGLLSLASCVKDICNIKIFDATIGNTGFIKNFKENGDIVRVGVSDDLIRKELIEFNPYIVGVSAQFFTQSLSVKETIVLIRETLPNVKIIVGGNYATCLKKIFLIHHPEVDVLVCGEGELTFRELCQTKCEELSSIHGILYKNINNDIVQNATRELISNMDELGIFDRSLINSKLYQLVNAPFFNEMKIELHKIRFSKIVRWLFKKNIITIPKNRFLAYVLTNNLIFKLYAEIVFFLTNKTYHPNSADIEMSRGCPFHCVFCAVKNTWTRKFRSRSIENIKSELIYLKNTRKIRHVNITDDVFNIDKNRIYELCNIFDELKIKSWRPMSGLYIMCLNKEILHRMYNTGCKHICLIIESGCQSTLDKIIKKSVNLNYSREIASACMEIGFTTHASFVIGFPDETKENILETIRYASSLEIDSCNFWFATPYPGTDLFDICQEKRLLPNEFDYGNLHLMYHTNFGKPMIETEFFTLEEIKRLRETANLMIAQKGKWEEWKYSLYKSFNYTENETV